MDKKPSQRWHGAHHYGDRVHFLFLLFLFLSIGVLVWSYFSLNGIAPAGTNKPTPSPNLKEGKTFCTQDAKKCPDGKWVGRSGPNCEFICP